MDQARTHGRHGLITSYVRCLRNRRFALIWSGQFLSNIGSAMLPVALPLLALKLGHGVGGVASVLIAEQVGSIAALPFAGVIADRVPRLKTMFVSDVARCLPVVGLANFQYLRSIVVLVVLSACLGSGSSFFATSYGAVMPELVEDQGQLPTANALTTISQQVGAILGPGVAGVVLAISVIYSVLWVDAATYLASIGTLRSR